MTRQHFEAIAKILNTQNNSADQSDQFEDMREIMKETMKLDAAREKLYANTKEIVVREGFIKRLVEDVLLTDKS